MSLSLKLFGGIEVRDATGAALTLPTRKTRALLSYLAVNSGRPQRRERLMALLWSDRGEKQARQSLNQALRAIRKLGESQDIDLIESDGESVMLRADAIECDADRFREFANDDPGKAAMLYTGPFLDDFSAQDPAFEEWLLLTRAEFHESACRALEAAAACDDPIAAIDYLRRLLALDPLREEAHRHLMRLLHQSGDRAAAIRQYRTCAEILARELQIEPDAATRDLFEQIRRDPGEGEPADGMMAAAVAEAAEIDAPPGPEAMPRRLSASLRWQIVAAVFLLFAVGGTVSVWLFSGPDSDGRVGQETPSPVLADKPSVAVLPFANLSGDSEQAYFSDGLTEDLITDLSKISMLTVLSRTATSVYAGEDIDIRQIGKALGVRYVIQGSVRKSGEQVRINAQLTDTESGAHLWAERYDGSLGDIFALQDQVLEEIVASLALKLSERERQRLASRGTDSVAAHDLYLRGLYQEAAFGREGNRVAVRLYEQALSIDPDYALPYTRISNILQMNVDNGWSQDMQGDLEKALELARKAARLDPRNPYIHWSLGRANSRFMTPDALERGIRALQRAIELDPDYADAYAFLAILHVADGRAEDGLRSIETAMQLNPRYPFWYLFMRGITRYVVEDYASAIADFEAAAERSPTALFVRWWLAAAFAQAGRTEDAEWQVDEMQANGFDGSIATIVDSGPIQDPAYVALLRSGLRKAGIPD